MHYRRRKAKDPEAPTSDVTDRPASVPGKTPGASSDQRNGEPSLENPQFRLPAADASTIEKNTATTSATKPKPSPKPKPKPKPKSESAGKFISLSRLYKHCPISTATTHIESRCSCSGGQIRFALVLVGGFGQSKQPVPRRYPKPIIPMVRAVVTVMAKWLYIQPMAI